MGNLIAFVTQDGAPEPPSELLQRGISITESIKGCHLGPTIYKGWSSGAVFPRWNGSGGSIVSDGPSGSWLAAVGTYFHASGDSRPERLLQEYLHAGAERLALNLDGFFAIVVGDGRTREVIVISDVIGSCHIFVRHLGKVTAVATSSLALARLADVSLDPVGCQEFLATGVMYEDRTFYRQVRKLPAATITSFGRQASGQQRRYWDPGSLSPCAIGGSNAAEALWHALLSAVNTIKAKFKHIVCDLTGGYDSRSIVAAFVGAGGDVCTVVSGRPEDPDVRVSRGLAAMLKLEHLHCPVNETITIDELRPALRLTDGDYDVVEYANVARIHRKLAKRFQISINGSFGELARGYWWELLIPRTGARRNLDSGMLARRRYAVGSCSDLVQPHLRLDLVQHVAETIGRTTAGLSVYPNTFQMDLAYLGMRMQRWQGRIASATNQIWPCLSPFMFRAALETMLQTDVRSRQRSLLIRQMLAAYAPSIAAFPLEHGYPALPVSWTNLSRFWPIVPQYAGRIAGKIGRTLNGHSSDPAASPRAQLWEAEEVRDLLTPRTMSTSSILDAAAVARFLEASQRPGFPSGVQWNRLLSLELAARCATQSGWLERLVSGQAHCTSAGG